MKIKIDRTEKNISKINTILDDVQKKASARLVDTDEIRRMSRKAEQHMERYGILKKDSKGCRYTYAEKVCCNSYGRSYAGSTFVELTRGPKDWFLTACNRQDFSTSRGARDEHFHATEQAIDSAMAQFRTNLERI